MQNSSRLHRGLLEACSRLSKTIVFLMQNASRLHRGLLEALKNHWFLYGTPHRGSLEAFESYCFPYAKRIEALSRLARGCQKPLVFIWHTSSRLARGFRKLLVSSCKTHRGFIEFCSRLLKTIGFYLAHLISKGKLSPPPPD